MYSVDKLVIYFFSIYILKKKSVYCSSARWTTSAVLKGAPLFSYSLITLKKIFKEATHTLDQLNATQFAESKYALSSFWSILFLQLIKTTHHYTSGNLSTNYNLKHSKVTPMLVDSFIHWQGYKHVLTWSEYLIYSNHVLPPLFSVTCYINTLLKMIAGYTSVKKKKKTRQQVSGN